MKNTDERMQKPRNRAPILFSLATQLMRHKVRGSSRLLRLADGIGLLDRPVRYPLGGGLHIDVPISRPDNCWDRTAIATYEERAIAEFASETRRLRASLTFIDCGADIGLFTLRFAALNKPSHVFAIEPDAEAFPWLEANLRQLNGKALKCAAASVAGNGKLAFPDYSPITRMLNIWFTTAMVR